MYKKKLLLLISLLTLSLCGCSEKRYTPLQLCYQECLCEYENETNVPYSYKDIVFEKDENYRWQWAYEITLYLDAKADVWICWLGSNAKHFLEEKPFYLYESDLKYPNSDCDCDFAYSITYGD